MRIKYIKCRLNNRPTAHREAESLNVSCGLQPFFPCTSSIHVALTLALMKLRVLNRFSGWFDFWEAKGSQTLAHIFLGEQGAFW